MNIDKLILVLEILAEQIRSIESERDTNPSVFIQGTRLTRYRLALCDLVVYAMRNGDY